MKNYVIVADGTCDLSEEMLKEFGIETVLGTISMPDGSEISPGSKRTPTATKPLPQTPKCSRRHLKSMRLRDLI